MRLIGLVLALGLILAPLAGGAQEAAKVARVGILSVGSDPKQPLTWQPFLDAMRELGYVEGRNLTVKRALGSGRSGDLPGLVENLVRSGVDVIVTTGTRETLAAKQATSTTPIVMLLVPDPVGQGLAKTLARPGGTVTGLTNLPRPRSKVRRAAARDGPRVIPVCRRRESAQSGTGES